MPRKLPLDRRSPRQAQLNTARTILLRRHKQEQTRQVGAGVPARSTSHAALRRTGSLPATGGGDWDGQLSPLGAARVLADASAAHVAQSRVLPAGEGTRDGDGEELVL